jgi:hypothetical protein
VLDLTREDFDDLLVKFELCVLFHFTLSLRSQTVV